MKLFRDENGQTLVFTALLMCCLVGFMALAVDVSVLIRAQRKVQTAADAAAIAGTLEYYYNGSTNAASVAKTAASNNGITDTNQVTVTIPPTYGWHTGTEYLEVIIKQPNPTIFMGTFAGLFPGGANTSYNPMTVAARAVAGIVPGASCVYLLNQSDAGALTIKGNADVTSPLCTWTVDSSSSQAFCITGQNSDAQFNTPGVILASGQKTSGKCNKLYGGATTGGTSGGDPLASTFSFPDPTKVCDATNTVPATYTTINSSNLATISAYKDGQSTGAYSTQNDPLSYTVTCFAGTNVTLSGVTLGSSTDENHLYLFKNGLVLSGTNTVYGTVDLNGGNFCQGSVQGSGCKFTSAGGGPSITINSVANTPPPNGTTYALNGMAFIIPPTNSSVTCDSSYQGISYSGSDPNSCLQIQFGSNSGTLDGMIYAPYSALYLQDSGGTGIGVTNLIVNSTFINGTLNITANYNYAHPDSPLNQVELVE